MGILANALRWGVTALTGIGISDVVSWFGADDRAPASGNDISEAVILSTLVTFGVTGIVIGGYAWYDNKPKKRRRR